MIKEALEYLEELGRRAAGLMDIGGRRYTYEAVELVKHPTARTLTTHTLTSLKDYLEVVERDTQEKLYLHVSAPDRVTLLSALTEDTRQREVLLAAECLVETFRFGEFMPQEQFLIALQSRFAGGQDMQMILKLAGNITDEKVATAEDDGVTQRVTGRAGIARVAELEVPNPVALCPFRTFPEVDQPESRFVFRVRSGAAGQPVTLALFEADGSAWKNEAIARVAEWLRDNVSDDVVVLA